VACRGVSVTHDPGLRYVNAVSTGPEEVNFQHLCCEPSVLPSCGVSDHIAGAVECGDLRGRGKSRCFSELR